MAHRWLGLAALALALTLTMSCGSDRESDSQTENALSDVPLAALVYLWFGFDLSTGRSIGGLGSSHWNTDVGSFGSRVGVTDEPEYGFYASDDPSVIARQLADMEEAQINTIIASWHGYGDRDFDGVVDDLEMEAMHRALIVMLDHITSTRAPFRVAVLVEPYMLNAESMTAEQKQDILDFLWKSVYQPYSSVMFQWEGIPLVTTWGAVDLKEPNDPRFNVKSWGSSDDPNWKTTTRQDWNWYPDISLLPFMISGDGMFVVYPRFDEYWMFKMGRTFPYPYRRVDPFLSEGAYERIWDAAIENRDRIKLLVLYSWNEHEEHAAIEPVRGNSPTSYGRALLDKTAAYYERFLKP